MTVLFFVIFVLALAYAALMLLYRYGWKRQPLFAGTGAMPAVSFSIIVPARNEETSIRRCIDSVLAQEYPPHLWELIVIDDHSTDRTAAIVAAYNDPRIRCLSLADYLQPGEQLNAYKKKALTIGIEASAGTLILTTDADCVAPPGWLRHLAACYEQQQPVMIVAPVDFTCNGSVVELLQQIDFMSMQGITAAAHALKLGNMSNGANLAFERAAFEQVGGYRGVDHLASGDDYLLMMKMQEQFPGRISYVLSQQAIVRTAPQPNWSSFLQQRIRWASKSGKYKDHRLTAILVLVYVYNLSFAALLAGGFGDSRLWCLLLASLALKTLAELWYLLPVARFFGHRSALRFFPFLQPLHILYIILAGFLGMVGTYRWKGRSVR